MPAPIEVWERCPSHMAMAKAGHTLSAVNVAAIVAYTAPSGSQAAAKLDFLRVSAVTAIMPGR